ncbi:hypothetical protein PROFUN_17008, partial [Planoprotostelium fungivorum]
MFYCDFDVVSGTPSSCKLTRFAFYFLSHLTSVDSICSYSLSNEAIYIQITLMHNNKYTWTDDLSFSYKEVGVTIRGGITVPFCVTQHVIYNQIVTLPVFSHFLDIMMCRLVFLLALVLLVRGDTCTFLSSQCNGTAINNTLPACWSCRNNTTPSQMDTVIIKELDLSQGTFGDLHVQRVELYDSSVTADTFTLVDLFVDANSTLRASSIFVDGNVDGGGSFIAQDVHLTSMNSKNWTIKSVRVSESLYITPIETPDAIITLSGSDALLNLNQIFFSQPAETFNHLEKSITIFKMINGSISLTPSSNASSVCYTLERHIEGNKLTVRPSGVEINLQWSESDDHLGNRIFSARLPPSIPCINVTSLTAQLGESKHSFTVKTEGDHNYTATVPLSAFPACTTVITLTTQGTVQGQVVRMIDTYPITPAEVSTYGMNVTGISSSLNSQRNNITYEWNTTSINQQTVCGMVPVSMKMNEEAVDIGSRMLIVLFATPICPPFTDGFSLNYNTSIWTPKV